MVQMGLCQGRPDLPPHASQPRAPMLLVLEAHSQTQDRRGFA